jgi:hypothetical protein
MGQDAYGGDIIFERRFVCNGIDAQGQAAYYYQSFLCRQFTQQGFGQLFAILCFVTGAYNGYYPGRIQRGAATVIKKGGRVVAIVQPRGVLRIGDKQRGDFIPGYEGNFFFGFLPAVEMEDTARAYFANALQLAQHGLLCFEYSGGIAKMLNKNSRLYGPDMGYEGKGYTV